MKKISKAISFLTALVLAFSALGVFAFAEDNQTDVVNTKKIVSIVYDNSGSMDNRDNRQHYAKYALEMLIALLDSQDELYIFPMHKRGSNPEKITVDLAADRDSVINGIFNSDFDIPSGGTPSNTIGKAVDALKQRGMKKSSETFGTESNTEYYLVILTDGALDSNETMNYQEKMVRQYASGYSGLQIIFFSFGKDGIVDMRGSQLKNELPFTGYLASAGDDLVKNMQQIACQMSGRYEMKDGYTVSGNKATIDLDTVDYSVASISAIAQNCGVTLQSADYNGQPMRIIQGSCIKANTALNIKNGFSAVIKSDKAEGFSGGKLVLTFSDSVPKDSLSILIEPALYIVPYIERQTLSGWTETNTLYINSNMKPGDNIRVNYKAYARYSDKEIDLVRSFGTVTATVSYAGKTHNINEAFPLVQGGNDIGVSASLMNGAYKLHASFPCYVEQMPEYFRIEHEQENDTVYFTVFVNNAKQDANSLREKGYIFKATLKDPTGQTNDVNLVVENGKLTAKVDLSGQSEGEYLLTAIATSDKGMMRSCEVRFERSNSALTAKSKVIENNKDTLIGKTEITVFFKDKQLTEEELKKYNWTITASDPGGNDYAVQNEVVNGKIVSTIDMNGGEYGSYVIAFNIRSVEGNECSLNQSVEKIPQQLSLELKSNGCEKLTQYKLSNNDRKIVFAVKTGGKPLNVNEKIIDCKVTFCGYDVSNYIQFENDTIVYIPNTSHIPKAISPTKTEVKVEINPVGISSEKSSASAEVEIIATNYVIEALTTSDKSVNRFDLKNNQTCLYFRILHDGVPLTLEEVSEAFDSGLIKISDPGIFSWCFWLPCTLENTVTEYKGQATVCCRVTDGWPDILNPVESFMDMFIFNGDKNVTVSYYDASGTDFITFTPSSAWEYIWRIIVFILIVYLTLFIIGFFTCKSLPSGLIVTVSPVRSGSKPIIFNATAVNLTFADKWLWHLKRLIPWQIFSDQDSVRSGEFELTLKKDRTGFSFIVHDSNIIKMNWPSSIATSRNGFDEFKKALFDFYFKNKGSQPSPTTTSDNFRSVFRINNTNYIADGSYNSYSGLYAQVNVKKGELIKIVFFKKK